jgi:signal transduction histidine kinase
MWFFPALIAVFLLGVGIAALSLHAKRAINQVLAAVCFAGVLFFAAQLTAKYEAAKYLATGIGSPLIWVRVKFAIVALISPTLVWLCYYVASGRYDNRRHLIRKMIPWVCLSCCLAAVAFTEGFKPNDSLPGRERYGPLYAAFFGPMLVGQLAVCVASIGVVGRLKGLRRLEFQFIALPLGYLSLAAVAVDLCFAVWPRPWLHTVTRAVSYLVYVAFGISAWSVTSHRVYHRQQVLLTIGQRLLVVGPIAFAAFWLSSAVLRYEDRATASAAAATVTGIAMLLAFALDDRIRARFRVNAENRLNEVSSQLHSVAKRQSSPGVLIEHFEVVLSGLSKSPVRILLKEGDEYGRDWEAVPLSLIEDRATLADGWYSLTARSRVRDRGSQDLREFLERKKWTALVFPGWETSPTLILAVAERENRLPFTFPELRALRTLTNVVESLYTHCRLALQARQAEQLAAIGKLGVSIAHELRNPMWTLSSFSQLLPERVNDSQFLKNFASIVPEEAKRIEALAEQLLDLARPREYNLVECDVHVIIEQTLTLLGAQLSESGVEIFPRLEADSPQAVVDRDAIRQVLLNLARNAAEALQANPREERKIEIRTAGTDTHLQIDVADNGPGIPDALRSKLFTAFASADKKAGLGLGLAVCKEIVAVHGGEISASNRQHGGTLITVSIPRRTGVAAIIGFDQTGPKDTLDRSA